MTDYREQVESAVRATRMESPYGFTWFGRPSPRLVRAVEKTLSPEVIRYFLVATLQRTLYEWFFQVGAAKPGPVFVQAQSRGGNSDFVRALSGANNGAGRWERGWLVERVAGNELTVSKEGLRVISSDWRVDGIGSPSAGQAVELKAPKDLVHFSPGYYLALGDRDLLSEPKTDVVRVYWNLNPEGAIAAMERLTTGLNQAGLPFRLKAINDPAAYNRGDSLVLYLHKDDFSSAAGQVRDVAGEISRYANESVPAFTKRISRGVAIAEDPGPGTSFGAERCLLVAMGLVQAFEAGQGDLASRLRAVEAQFDGLGVSLDTPYLNPGSVDTYETPASVVNTSGRRRPQRSSVDFLSAAEQIGRELCSRAIWNEGRCTWLGQSPDSRPGQRIEGMGPDLYAGSSGIGLFLAELAAATANEETKRTSLGALRHALSRVEGLPPARRIGLFDGSIGVAVAAVRAGFLLHEASLIEDARSLALGLTKNETRAEADDDLLAGRAGAIIGLLLLNRMLQEPTLIEPAIRMAGELIERATRGRSGWSWKSPQFRRTQNLTGMSHGAAGIGLALIELSRATGEERFRETAEAAFAYERSWFDATTQNWPDFRGVSRARRDDLLAYSTDWCHGAPGIALSRLAAFRILDDDLFKREAALGLDTTLKRVSNALQTGFDVASLCLCHGPLACAEALLVGAAHLGDSRYRRVAQDFGAYAATSLSAEPSARWDGSWSPGLMTGMAGQGYFFLRLLGRPMPSLLLPLADDFVV